MNLAGGIGFLLFVVIGGWLTWPSAEERAANDASERRWLGEAGFHGPAALSRFRWAQVASAVGVGTLMVALVSQTSKLAVAVGVACGTAVALAIPNLVVEIRRHGR